MALQQDKENGNLQRRSSWTCDSVTISYASRRGTNRCRRCKGFLAEGELRFGVSDMLSADGTTGILKRQQYGLTALLPAKFANHLACYACIHYEHHCYVFPAALGHVGARGERHTQ